MVFLSLIWESPGIIKMQNLGPHPRHTKLEFCIETRIWHAGEPLGWAPWVPWALTIWILRIPYLGVIFHLVYNLTVCFHGYINWKISNQITGISGLSRKEEKTKGKKKRWSTFKKIDFQILIIFKELFKENEATCESLMSKCCQFPGLHLLALMCYFAF